jgi:AcrR family transcriptional regulator
MALDSRPPNGDKRCMNASPAPSSTRRVRDPEQARAKILKAATQSFAAHGFEGATLPKIAAASGTSTPLIVHYYKSKRLLWEAVFEQLSVSSREKMSNLAAETNISASERLRRIIAFQAKYFAENPEVYLMLASEAHLRSERLTWICDQFARPTFNALIDTIRAAQAEGAVRPVSPERLRYMIINTAAIAAVAAEYEALTGQDPREPEQVAATIDFINQMVFVDSKT